jgi:PPK2 family polyphosphate:nucleotide phosphotransferase
MALDVSRFRARQGQKIDLKKWPTRVPACYDSRQHYEALLADHVRTLSQRQTLLYAHDRYALLLIFQAMDAAGKDGAIKHVMSGVNPQGCQVFTFKHPSAEELDHDFLWRTTRALPERGRIGIFNRSYYEEVLIVRVQPGILAAQRLPDEMRAADGVWSSRYRSIVDFEAHLHRNGTRILKFFLHVSKEEQRQRLLARLDDPDKHWKFDERDLDARARWHDYMRAYERCIEATSTRQAPWFIVPADDKENARLIVSQAVLDGLAALRLRFPRPDRARVGALRAARRRLLAE